MPRRAEPITKRTTKNGDVRYTFLMDVGVRADGERDRRRFTYRTLAEARREYRRLSTEVAEGRYVKRHSRTVSEYLTGWLDGRHDVRTVTLTGYRYALKPVIDRLGELELQQLTKEHVDDLVGWRMEGGRAPVRRISDRGQQVLVYVARHRDGVTYRQVQELFGEAGCRQLDRLREAGHITRPSRGRYVAAVVEGKPESGGVSARTITTMLTVLGAALDDAVAEGLITRNAAKLAKKPKVAKRTTKWWTEQHLTKFLAHVEGRRDGAVWMLTAYGLRRSEVLGMRWSAIDFTTGKVTVEEGRVVVPGGTDTGEPKSERSRRTLPMPPEVMAAFKALRAAQAADRLLIGDRWPDTGLVAVNGDGSPIRPETYSAAFGKLCSAAGVPPIGLHGARHSSVSLMLERGVNPVVVAAWHGHDPALMLRVYGHADADSLARAGASLFSRSAAGDGTTGGT